MIRLAVRCPRDRAELVTAALLELSPAGIEQVDGPEITELAIYGPPGELPDLGDQRATIAGVPVEVRSVEVADDWADRWKQFHQPVEIGGRVRIRPPWLEPEPGLEDIVIDPGRAFGTAAHPTTRMCSELLIAAGGNGTGRGPLADVGTGTGVLAILAARLGWRPVIALDNDPAAIEAATANAAANAAELDLRRVDLRRELPPPAPFVVANLTADLLVALARCYSVARTPRALICSGLVPEQADAVERAFWSARMVVRERRESGGWMALALAARR